MAQSLIRKTQLHPDISDLVSGYGFLFFPSLNNFNLLSGNFNIVSENLNILTGNLNILSGNLYSLGISLNDLYSTVIFKTGNQTISGIKNFSTKPTVNGSGILLSGDILASDIPSVIGNDNIKNDIESHELAINILNSKTLNIFYTTGNQTVNGIKQFSSRPNVNGSGVLLQGDILQGNITGIENAVSLTGDQEIFGHKKFEKISNLEDTPFLLSGEGKYVEKYFDSILNTNNSTYYSPKYRNSFIFLNIFNTGTYSIYLPSVTGALETDFIKYTIGFLPSNTGENTGLLVSTGFDTNCLGCNITGFPTYDVGISGINCQNSCLENYIYDPQIINNDFNENSNIIINFYTDYFIETITGSTITGFITTGDLPSLSGTTGLYTDYQQSIFVYSLFNPNVKDSISFIFRDGYWYLENEKIALTPESIPPHTHEFSDIIDPPINIVYTDGDQTISGIKQFSSRPNVNGSGVFLYGDDLISVADPLKFVNTFDNQTISGIKTFKNNINISTINGNTSFGIYHFNLETNFQNQYLKQAAILNDSISGIKNEDIVNLYFDNNYIGNGISYGYSKTLKVNPGVLVNHNNASSSRNLIKFSDNSQYSGKAIRKIRYNSTIGNGYERFILTNDSNSILNCPIIKPKTRRLETFYDINVPSGGGTRFIKFEPPTSFPFVQGLCLNLRFNFSADNNPCVIRCRYDNSLSDIFILTGANYNFIQKERVILISKGEDGNNYEFKHW